MGFVEDLLSELKGCCAGMGAANFLADPDGFLQRALKFYMGACAITTLRECSPIFKQMTAEISSLKVDDSAVGFLISKGISLLHPTGE